MTRREWLAAGMTGTLLPIAFGRDKEGFTLSTFEAEVTPPLGHPCMGGGIAPVKSILDPLFARGFVLQGAGKPLVIVSVDWCEIRNGAYDRWRTRIAEAVGTDPVRVLLNANHQHDAPIADLEAQELLEAHGNGASICDRAFHERIVTRVADAAKASLRATQPVTHIGTGQARVDGVASNRRYTAKDGTIRYDRMSATRDAAIREADSGTIDPNLKTLSFWNGTTPVLFWSAYATHPMSYYGRGEVSADFIGIARRKRQTEVPGTMQIYSSGCSGNVTAGKFNDGSPENRTVLAERIAKAMKAAADATVKHPLKSVSFRSVPLVLEPRLTTGFSEAELMTKLKTDSKPFGRCLAALGLSWLRRCQAKRPIDLPVVDFGPAQFVLLPAESYVEFQLAAQALRPDSFVMVAGYGECGPGYIPIERAWKERDGNLSDWCWVAESSEAQMSDALKKALLR
jgi:hypothetical protein